MNLLDLPNELLVTIASSIETDQDLNAFARTNRFVYSIANRHLYEYDARRKKPMSLSWAARHDREHTARKSLEAGAGIGFLLVEAAKHDSANVLELFLSWEGVDPNVEGDWEDDNVSRTALSWAAGKGFVRIVELLLAAKGISPDSKDAFGQTPLAFASKHGQTAVVSLLLERLNVDVNNQDNDNCTPLHGAALAGHAEVVEILLSHHADPNVMENENQTTPLAAASATLRMVWDSGPQENEARYLQTIELLLRHPKTTVGIRDRYVSTLYDWCAQDGYDTIFGLLLAKRNGAEANPIAAGGRDLLSWAAANGGHGSIMKLFLAEDGVNPDRRDMKGRTPLSYAAGNGHAQAVRVLLDSGRVEMDSTDEEGKTPLFWAIESLCAEAVEFFLARGATPPMIEDIPALKQLLSRAVEYNDPRLLKILPKLCPDRPEDINLLTNGYCQTLLSIAAQNGSEAAARYLLDETNININSRDTHGQTALSHAVSGWQVAMLEMLLAEDDIDPNVRDEYGHTALTDAVDSLVYRLPAAQKEHQKGKPLDDTSARKIVPAVERLLAHPKIDPSSSYEDQVLELIQGAAKMGYTKLMELLVLKDDRIRADVVLDEKTGRTLLKWAKRNYRMLARLLREKDEWMKRSGAVSTK